MKNVYKLGVIFSATLLLSSAVNAAPLVYVPQNSSFGGNPMNDSNLLARAEVSRPTDPSTVSRDLNKTPAERLADQIQSQVLASISSGIAAQIVGPDAQNTGAFDLGGGASINFRTEGGNRLLNIIGSDGSITTLSIPISL